MHRMTLEVKASLPNPVRRIGGSNRFSRRYRTDGRHAQFLISPYRLIGPVIYTGNGAIIYADAPMPDKYAAFADLFTDMGAGNRRFPVVVNHNRNSLAPFLASGLLEMDVTEVKS